MPHVPMKAKSPKSTENSSRKKAPKKPEDKSAGELHDFEVVARQGGGFGISFDGRDMLLPTSEVFWTPSRAYAEFTMKILADGGEEHFTENRALICHECTLFIGFSSGFVAPENEAIAEFKANPAFYATYDPIHALCAGPEKVDQLERLQPFRTFCDDREIKSPSWPQSGIRRPDDSKDFRDVIKANNANECDIEILRYFETLEREFRMLSQPQIAVMHTYFTYCACHFGQPFVLPLLLVKGLCTPKEFAVGFLATLCIIPGVFGDVSKADYNRDIKRVERDAGRALFFLNHH
jgi:hypothetical protein